MPESLVQCDLNVSDYQEIVDLWLRAGLTIRGEGRDGLDAFTRQMSRGLQRVVGLRDGGRLLAVVVLTHDGRKGWINRLAVDPTCRRRGLGARLVAEAERWFTDVQGLEVWAALIERENVASQMLFEGLGYRSHDLVYVTKRTRAGA